MWSRSVTTGSTVIVLLIARSLRAAASALGRFSATSSSSNRIWRWRLWVSMKSRSMIRIDPDAGPGQVVGQHGPQRAAAAERDPALQAAPLARPRRAAGNGSGGCNDRVARRP